LRNGKASAFFPQQIRLRHAYFIITHFSMAAPTIARLAGRAQPAAPSARPELPPTDAEDEVPPPPEWLNDVPPIGEPAPVPASASAPTPPPVVAPPPKQTAPVGPSLASARESMRPIYDKAKSVGFQLGALLNGGCDIIRSDEDTIVLGFRHEFHAIKASENANLDALTRIISEVLGRQVSVRCELADDVIAWTQREATSRGRDNPLVRAAQQMGAQVVRSGSEEPSED
jgi:hypothetical protein